MQNSLLVIKYSSSGQYDLPFGDPISNESAQCTAHRHTWEQTGFNVEVDQLLGVSQSGMMLFSCGLSSGFTSDDGPLEPPSWANSNIQQIEFISPFDTRYDVWQQPDNLIMYRDGFVAVGDD
ncbi:MutT/nudix family protein [Brumicola nitratireducens]|uniref:MutT/nudix family protein n=1 Tax=Glaciecola nitratireducens (strain JCM 12485 / KCTC 12276 / FR1064) TaxID=1085623 RepID=G4QMH4_GLANF|nr:MutT/nudix family protein [Glaciecola nitratireducens]AEP30926.1 MutT/nudix family protein [Glaciecola nitratireducens FR1064]